MSEATNKKITAWGFGMAPLEKKTKELYRFSLKDVANYISYKNYSDKPCGAISTVKGMLDRILKQDQRDWFTVYEYFNYPDLYRCREIAILLIHLRCSVMERNKKTTNHHVNELNALGMIDFYNSFSSFSYKNVNGEDYLYILSRKDNKNILKIGMTTRSVSLRVKEINSTTGLLYPISERAV